MAHATNISSFNQSTAPTVQKREASVLMFFNTFIALGAIAGSCLGQFVVKDPTVVTTMAGNVMEMVANMSVGASLGLLLAGTFHVVGQGSLEENF
jgi:hypothetical protein